MGSRATRSKSKAASNLIRRDAVPKRSRRLVIWLAASTCIPLVVLLCFFFADVRLGQGFFAIRYSPVAGWRLLHAFMMIFIGTLACSAIWALAHRPRSYRFTGGVLFVLCLIGFGGFAWLGPPEPLSQQAFNMTSFSTDGAFVFESNFVSSAGEYLREFPDGPLKMSVEEKGGTRVLSNPPLTTILAYGVKRAFGQSIDTPGSFEQSLVEDRDVIPRDAPTLANGLRFSVLLCALWILGGFVAYGLGRSFLSPAGAALFAIVVTFNPCTVHFSPGKDPAQLLTINTMLWAWFSAWKRKSPALAAAGGAVLTIGCTAGLIHVWAALVAVVATLWHSWRDRSVRTAILNSVGAAAGGLVVCAIAYLTIRWNIPYTLWAVSKRWNELQPTFNLSRPIWYAIGLPIFLLFLSPGVWTALGLNLSRRRLGFGMRLAIVTAATMLFIYGPLGMTYELPRLWIAFLPTLTLGLMIDRPMFHAIGSRPRVATALVLIVAAQIVFTSLHWTLFDARESEFRLTSNRLYN